MKFEGLKQQAVCKDDGLWSIPTPQCLAPCLVPSIAHGQAEARLGEKIGHGESLVINCTDNYEVGHGKRSVYFAYFSRVIIRTSFTIVLEEKLFFLSHSLNFLFIICPSHSPLSHLRSNTRESLCSAIMAIGAR